MNDDLKVHYESQGYLHVPGVVSGPMLTRLQNAFDAAAAKYSGQWPASSKDLFYDIPHILDQDDVFVDLADIPTLFPIILAIIGSDIQLLQTQARLLRPGPAPTPPWHSDMEGLRGVNIGQTLNFHLKVHFYPYDLTPEQGTLAFLPGSHRYPEGIETPNIPEDSQSSVVRRVVPRAGDAVVFNTHLLHMAQANRSKQIRKSLIYSYSHFWVRGTASGVPKDLDRLATTPQRRQLFQQWTEDLDAPPFFVKAYEPEAAPDLKGELKGLMSAGQNLLRRTLKGDKR